MALLIGAYDYKKPRLSLLGPQNDVRLIENGLKPLEFDVRVVSDREASRYSAVSAWEDLTAKASCGDQVFLMLSGYATATPNTGWRFHFEDAIEPETESGKSQQDGQKQATWSDAELATAINRVRARRANVTVLLDSAFSDQARLFAAPQAGAALTNEPWDILPENYGALNVLLATGMPLELRLPRNDTNAKTYGAFSYAIGLALGSGPKTVQELIEKANQHLSTITQHASGGREQMHSPMKANYATSNSDLPFLYIGLKAPSPRPSAEVQIDNSDGKQTRGVVQVNGTLLTGQVKPIHGLLELVIAGRRVADVQPDGRFRVEVPLRRGDNDVDVAAMYTNRPTMVTRMTIHSTGGQWHAERPAQSYALLIANERYDRATSGFDPLKTPKADAECLAQELRTRYGFRTSLPRGDGSERPLILHNANRADIFRALDDFARVATPDDAVFIFYAGHGQQLKTALPSGSHFVKTYWVPSDARAENGDADWVFADDINTKIARIRARHVLLVSDSCYAGGLSRSGDDSISLQKAEPDRYLSEMSRKRSRYLLASGGDHPVDDTNGSGHSPFANALLSVLRNPPAPAFTLQQVFPDLQKRVSNTTNQTPEFPRLRGEAGAAEDGGAMVFFAI